MNAKSLNILEFQKITDELKTHADSDPARKMIEKLRPSTKKDWILNALDETDAAVNHILKCGNTSFGSNRDLGYALKSVSIGHALSAPELLSIASFLENVQRVKSYGSPKEKDALPDQPDDTEISPGKKTLDTLFDELTPLVNISKRIREVIISEDEIADSASPKLASIRRKIKLTGDKIHSQLNSMINGSLRTYLQDPVITMRGDRYCIPVKAEYKGQVPGMIHDQSATGSTFFIEPQAVVEMNNQIKSLTIDEQREIERILAEISASVGEHAEDISVNCRHMTRLDFIFAKARLALEMDAHKPIINDNLIIRLKGARHPLIDRKKVVPIDVTLGDEYSMLIITGPNTGGKTVSLKTVGLLSLMGQAGLFIPAKDRSELSVFGEIYADIGDEQSIEQSLSTFSAHMTNIVDILKHATPKSLCLFDELGAGTDPTEGAALAVAILDSLHKSDIRVMATTHYSELKVYALTTDRAENACCEFDVEKLSPTYRLLTGIPGRSNAFAIALRLGLSEDVIESAKLNMTEDQMRFEELMADLDRRRINMERSELEMEKAKELITSDQEKIEAARLKLDTSKDRILEEAKEEAREILREAKEEADRTIRFFQNATSSVSMRELEEERARIRKKIEKTERKNKARLEKEQEAKQRASEVKPDPETLSIGDSVRILSLGLKGTVATLPDKAGKLFVQCGIMRSQTTIDDIVLTAADTKDDIKADTKPKKSTSSGNFSKALNISPEINLLGLTTDEAIYKLDKYLDDAYLSHLSSVRIVHGKGTGALRNAVQNHLRKTSYIKSFRLGEFGEGDAGVTIAEFK